MPILSPFSISIPRFVVSHSSSSSSSSRPKFTLDDDHDSDPPSIPSSTSVSPGLLTELDFSSYTTAPSTSHSSTLLRSLPVSNSQLKKQRRWTLAMAVTDEGITDEALVETLERIRLHRESSGCLVEFSESLNVDRDIWNWNLPCDDPTGEQVETIFDGDTQKNIPEQQNKSQASKLSYTPSLPSFPLQHRLSAPSPSVPCTPPTAAWQIAQQSLLTCRELVRTERQYLSSLRRLINSDTLTPPPPLMIHYVIQLAFVSERFLSRIEEDPSAWGVAAAFLSQEEYVEDAFVGWCGVVAGWFEASESTSRSSSIKSGGLSPKRRLSKGRPEDESTSAGNSPTSSPIRRSVSTWRKSVPSMTSINNTSLSPLPSPNIPSPTFSASLLSWRKDKDKTSQGSSAGRRKPAVRELAIMPTQRILRYVLLYRNLLAHTPSTSPSRTLVERAVEAACRIAQKCDRAQDNAAFLSSSSSSSTTTTIITTPSSHLNRQSTEHFKNFLTKSRKSSTC